LQLGERIKMLRKEKGFNSYEHFAYDIEISRSGYAKYEGGADMRVSTLLKIIYGLDLTLDEFFKEGFK
jgi:transcriptional regulator with XRE-family HTH domain